MALPAVLSAACAGGPAAPPPAPPPAPHAQPPPPPLPAWTYWEPVEASVLPAGPVAEVPVDLAQLGRTPGGDVRWAAAPRALREAVAAKGFGVLHPAHPVSRLGDFYASLRDDRVAWVLTLDAMFFVTHLAVDRALADVDVTLVAPSLATMLRRLDLRLTAESRGAGADMTTPYLVARGVVAVALALVDPAYAAPEELVPLVQGEKARILTHEGVFVSPWLGVPVDYSAMSPRGQADRDEAHANWFRAVAWLEGAALALEGLGEGSVRAQVDVATARVHARAALLLARLLDYEVDAEAASAWDRVARVNELLVGSPDDPTARDLAQAASAQKLDVRNGDWFSNVAPVDRVRHATAKAKPARIDDGALGSVARAAGLDPRVPMGHLAPGIRPRRAAGRRPTRRCSRRSSSRWSARFTGREPPPTDRDGVRAMPSALDVAAWLGSAEARLALHAAGDDAYARYAEALDRQRPGAPAPTGALGAAPDAVPVDARRHRDAGSARRSGTACSRASASTKEWRERKGSVALGAWTKLRHDATPMSRLQVLDLRVAPHLPVVSPVPVFVEPHPEAIAKCLSVVRQVERALVDSGSLPRTAPSIAVLEEVDDLLWSSLGVAAHEASDRAVPPELQAALALFPARLRALESSLTSSGAAEVPLVAGVHTDRPSGRALEEALGRVEELWTVMREPETHRLWLAVGASIPHAELVQPMAARWSDGVAREARRRRGRPVAARWHVVRP